MADILVGSLDTLEIVAIDQSVAALPFENGRKLPGQILRILNAGIGAARAERRHLMRGIADEDHAAMHEAVEPAAVEGVDRDPFELVGMVFEHLVEPRTHALRRLLGDRVGVGTELQIDAPDVVGLAMHQGRLAGMKGRREPEPALGRKLGRHVDIGDEEFVLEGDTGEVEAQKPARGRARTVGGDEPIGVEPVRPVRRVDSQPRAIVEAVEADEPVLPAQIKIFQLERAIDQCLFQIELLQIDEGGHLVPLLRQQIERIEQFVADKDLAELPGDALRHKPLADAEPVEDFERALRPADAARAFADPIRIVDQHDRHGALREIDRGRKADRSGADNDDRPPHDRRRVLIGGAAIVVVIN